MGELNTRGVRQFPWAYAGTWEKEKQPFYLCRLPVSGVCPLWSSRQGDTAKMVASFENE